MPKRRKILITGSAGFIGFHLARRLLEQGREVVGLDNLNEYYDVSLKKARLGQLTAHRGFRFFQLDLADRRGMEELLRKELFGRVVHLAAQAGVRHSVTHPHSFVEANLAGFLHVLEGCRHTGVEHLVYASSSAVYGSNTRLPFSVRDPVDHPVSLYGATKKANELMAHVYAHLFGLPSTGLRFFTVYGPLGRPDMALFLFTEAILEGRPIRVFNYGKMQRDFTYVDDVIEGVVRVMEHIPQPNSAWESSQPDPGSSAAPYRVYNIGNNQPVELLDFIAVIEKKLGKKAQMNLLPMEPGDVLATCADVEELVQDIDFQPRTPLEVGIGLFIDWYRDYYKK